MEFNEKVPPGTWFLESWIWPPGTWILEPWIWVLKPYVMVFSQTLSGVRARRRLIWLVWWWSRRVAGRWGF